MVLRMVGWIVWRMAVWLDWLVVDMMVSRVHLLYG